MQTQHKLLAASLLAFGGLAVAQRQAPVVQEGTSSHLLVSATNVLGLHLQNASDTRMGQIGDLLIDPRSGEIRYAVLDVGGFLGMGEDHRIVPWSRIEILPGERDTDKFTARTTLTEAQIQAAPLCKADDVFTPELDRRIEAAFGKDDGRTSLEGRGAVQDRDATSTRSTTAVVRLTAMDGVLIKDQSGKEVGTVKDLVLAPNNHCIAYAVVDAKKDAGGKTVALPISRLHFALDRENKMVATTPVEITRFVGAPEYDSKSWKRMSSTAWMNELATYYGTEPFWKNARFASARKPAVQGQ